MRDENTTLDDLIKRDSITAAWFWVTSLHDGPYAENEKFDVVFTRQTNCIVGGGYNERRTFYVQGIITAQVDSRRKNGGRIIRPDLPSVLAEVIANTHEAAQYDSFAEWAEDCRDMSLGYRYAITDFEDWETHRARHRALVAWLGQQDSDDYDTYVKAAQEYQAEH
jgi:hypothetical protein